MKDAVYKFDIIEEKGYQMVHFRQAYNIFDVIGDLGGVLEIMIMFIGIIFFPIAEHSFNIKFINKLLLGKSENIAEYKKFGILLSQLHKED